MEFFCEFAGAFVSVSISAAKLIACSAKQSKSCEATATEPFSVLIFGS